MIRMEEQQEKTLENLKNDGWDKLAKLSWEQAQKNQQLVTFLSIMLAFFFLSGFICGMLVGWTLFN